MLPEKTFVIIGPESTGKTTLCKELAKHFNSHWIPEYAREYLEKIKRKYNYLDVLHIAHKQIKIENEVSLPNDTYLFIDTDLIITKIWFKHVYNEYPLWIDDYLSKAYRKAYLIAYPDIPWQYDPLRENPHIREYLFDLYVKEVEKFKFSYHIIKGLNEQRTMNAINYCMIY